MAWRSGVIDRIAAALEGVFYREPGPVQEVYTIEFEDMPAQDVANILDRLMLESPRTLLVGVNAFHVDPETGEESVDEWRMLGNRAPGTLAIAESAARLGAWAEGAIRRSRVVLMAKSLTVRVYPVWQ